MARTEYPDPEGEAAYQDIASKSSQVSAPIFGTWPEASFGGRTGIEVSQPNLSPGGDGPSQSDLEKRKRK